MSKKQNSLKQIYTPAWQPKVLVGAGTTTTTCFMPNHVLVNREREMRGKRPLQRSRTLDLVAGMWAHVMAAETSLFHPADDIDSLKELLQSNDAVAENIQRGPSIQAMHEAAMERETSTRANILSSNFDEFGMGTARGADGKIYMVQFFRRKPLHQVNDYIDNIPASPGESACQQHYEQTPPPSSCDEAFAIGPQQQQQQVWRSSALTISI
jgi:Cysteine-rich secretory protein family